MATAATPQWNPAEGVLCLAPETRVSEWKLAFSGGMGQRPRMRTIPAGNLIRLPQEIERTKERFGLPEETPGVSCYEAGRDGFWLHRALVAAVVEGRTKGRTKGRTNALCPGPPLLSVREA
jgi:transposase